MEAVSDMAVSGSSHGDMECLTRVIKARKHADRLRLIGKCIHFGAITRRSNHEKERKLEALHPRDM